MYTIKTRTDNSDCVEKEIYDSKERLVRKEMFNSVGESDGVIEYFYDKDNNLIKSAYTHDDYSQTTEYTYDEKGNSLLCLVTDSDGYEKRTEYVYDEKGNKSKTVIKIADGQDVTIKHTYDEEGRLVKDKQKSSDGNEYVSIYTYDEKGNVTRKETSDLTGYTSIEEKTYDENGNVLTKTERSSHLGGTVESESVKVYTYDEKGNVIREEYTIAKGKERVKEYTYTEEKTAEINRKTQRTDYGPLCFSVGRDKFFITAPVLQVRIISWSLQAPFARRLFQNDSRGTLNKKELYQDF